MNVNILVMYVVVFSLAGGIGLGFLFATISRKREEKRLLKNLEEVLDGKRKNVLTIDGKEYEALRFKVKDKDGKNMIIDFKGGGKIKNEKEKSNEESTRSEVADINPIGENSPSLRKKKRDSRTRPRGSGRRRRFG